MKESTASPSALFGILSVLLASLWALLRSPVAESPVVNDILSILSVWPTQLEEWTLAHYYESPTHIIIAHTLGVDTSDSLVRLGAVASIIAVVILGWWLYRNSLQDKWRATRLLILSPVVTVLFFWLGFYDPYTVIAWGILLWGLTTRRISLVVLCAIPAGFQHFQITALGTLALFLTWIAWKTEADSVKNLSSPLWALLGVFIGKGIQLSLSFALGHALESRSQWISQYFDQWFKDTLLTGPILLYSLFAGLWAVVLYSVLDTKQLKSKLFLASAFLLGILGTLLSADRPRVFILIMLPSLILAILRFVSNPETSLRTRRLVESIAWISPPVLLGGLAVMNVNVVDISIPAWLHVLGLG